MFVTPTFRRSNCVENTQKSWNGAVLFAKFVNVAPTYHCYTFRKLHPEFSVTIWNLRTTTPACCGIVNLFYNFEAMLTKYYHTTLNNPHLRFFAKLTQRWCNVVISTSRRRCKFDVASMNFKH